MVLLHDFTVRTSGLTSDEDIVLISDVSIFNAIRGLHGS
jgi:hypothetical protein